MARLQSIGWGALSGAMVLGIRLTVLAADAATETSPVDLGRQIFVRNFGLAGSGTGEISLGAGGDGLGPLFNDFSCVACHRDGGVGGSGPNDKNALILSLIPPERREPKVLNPLLREARELHPDLSATQTSVPLHRFGLRSENDSRAYEDYLAQLLDQLGAKPHQVEPVRGVIGRGTYEVAQRNTTALWGVGLIEELRQREGNGIRRRVMEEQNRKFPWLSGRVPRDAVQNEAWFGWRGQSFTLLDFTKGACATEIGLTVPGAPQHASPVAPPSPLAPKLDLTEGEVAALTAFVASLPAPRQVIPADPSAALRVELGAEIFDQCHCTACHVPNLGFVEGIYSDLLLHDMGPRLCDGSGAVPELLPGEVIPSGFRELKGGGSYGGPPGNLFIPPRIKPTNCECEWRTPPLWGCADSAPYLHDGRAATLDEAILWHGGEAERARDVYRLLTPADRSLLLAFLESLRAPHAPARPAAETHLAAFSSSHSSPVTVTSLRPRRPEGENPAAAASPPDAATASPPDAAPALPAVEPAAEAIAVVDEGGPPAPPPPPPLALPQTEYALLVELLEGLTPSGATLPRAVQLRNQLQGGSTPPGAADYALGLFQRQALKSQGALASFSAAARQPGPFGLRARRVLIREELRKGAYGAALLSLEQLVRDAASAGEALPPRDQWDTVEWAGVILGWMQGPAGVSAAQADVPAATARIRSTLTPQLQAALEAGLTRLTREHARLDEERRALLGVEEAERTAQQQSLARRDEELLNRQTGLSRTQAELEQEVTTEVRKIDEQLQELEKQYLEREAVDRQLVQLITPLQLRVFGILQHTDRHGRLIGLNQQELAGLQDQLNLLNRRREENRAEARIAALKAQRLAQQREILVRQLAHTTGTVAQEQQTLSTWRERVARQATALEESTADQSRRVKALDRRLRELATYDRFDPREEARLLLGRLTSEE